MSTAATAEVIQVRPLAVALAEAAVHGGVAEQVIRLLSGAPSAEGDDAQQCPALVEVIADETEKKEWDAGSPEPECSVRTTMSDEDDGELSKLMQKVRERRTSPRQKKKHASS